MYFFYVDDSKDGHFYTFSAIGVPAARWREVQDDVLAFRRGLKEKDGILIRKELHAWKFVSGRGRPAGQRFVSIERRCQIFKDALSFLASLAHRDVILFNVAMNREDWAFERLLNRINRTMQARNDYAVLICDEGNELEITRLVRKMGVFNPIPSRYGGPVRNVTIDRILEDPVFRQSHRSTLIQLADFCAYALLRKEKPLASKTALGLDSAFNLLEPICFKGANTRDPFGIIK